MTVETPIEMLHLPEQLRSLFAGKLPEAATGSPEERQRNFLSRTLAAYAIHKLGGADLDQAAAAVVDGGGDGGIDAIFHSTAANTLWVAQSKFIASGRGEPDLGDVTKFKTGVENLLQGNFEAFRSNESWNRILPTIELVFERGGLQVRAILVYSGINLVSEDRKHLFEDLKRRFSADDDYFDIRICNDILRTGGKDDISAHFVGSIVYIEKGLYLTFKTGDIPNIREVYDAFKTHARDSDVAAQGVDTLLADIHAFAEYYCAMALGKETDKDLSVAFKDLRELKVDVSYPFLLELYHDYRQGFLTKEQLSQAVRLVEAYVFRRAVCSIPTNSLNKTFATFCRALKKDHYLESIQAHLLLLPSYRRFPSDEEFKREITLRNLYNFRSCSYWLRRIENRDRKEFVPVDEYTIEHILPQNENLSTKWREALGVEWRRIHETYLHTLGNLTLTGYNSEYSDRPFSEKRDMKGGFKESPLRLNEGLGTLEIWNETTIKTRANRLATTAAQVWSPPSLSAEILETYRPKADKVSGYTIDDHPHLVVGNSMRPLFEVFRKEVLNLDPCVTEEFLKLYVAYKAETNFVDVVPQAKRLRLSLNMQFHELHDPKGFAKDVTNLGRWGNGDVEVGLSSEEELPYVMGLVRQSYEKQMGNGEVNT